MVNIEGGLPISLLTKMVDTDDRASPSALILWAWHFFDSLREANQPIGVVKHWHGKVHLEYRRWQLKMYKRRLADLSQGIFWKTRFLPVTQELDIDILVELGIYGKNWIGGCPAFCDALNRSRIFQGWLFFNLTWWGKGQIGKDSASVSNMLWICQSD